jgi:ABC-type uncharacterized transport system substrate-binding protein
VTSRRIFLVAFAGGILAIPLAADAQEHKAGKVPVIGVLSASDLSPWIKAFRPALADLGWMEGRSVHFEARSAEGKHERLRVLAEELVRLHVTVIVTTDGTPPALAAKKATASIPIVFVTAGDPVAFGIVSSFARPSGNITGFGGRVTVGQKRLELLREVAPHATRVAILTNPTNPIQPTLSRTAESAARQLGVKLYDIEVRGPEDFDRAFQKMLREGAEALVVSGDVMLLHHRANLVARVAKTRLPAIYADRAFAEAGGLMSYNVDFEDLLRKAAGYVDRILRGAKLSDLLVQEATKFQLSVNLKTAKSLGLTIPESVLLRADQVIE